jgi:hypothetical protein
MILRSFFTIFLNRSCKLGSNVCIEVSIYLNYDVNCRKQSSTEPLGLSSKSKIIHYNLRQHLLSFKLASEAVLLSSTSDESLMLYITSTMLYICCLTYPRTARDPPPRD